MCGICGFAGRGDRSLLSGMVARMHHRGPDANGVWLAKDRHVGLGHARLSIIDIAGGHQPMMTADHQLAVVFNGEIYNHLALREELLDLGHRFRSDHSDTEVLLHGYRQWGDRLPERLNGMWAFAIFDVQRNRLFLSRDRFGKKPLYYCFSGDRLVFASELTALADAEEITPIISPLSIQKYFALGFIPSPHTIYSNIAKLPAGCNLSYRLDDHHLMTEQYWRYVLEPATHLPKNPEREWGGRLRELLEAAVQRRLMSDVPLGIFLSGGIDSSAVTAFATAGAPPGSVSTFAIGFNEASFDESEYAERIARQFQTHHHMNVLSMADTQSLAPDIIARLDEPMGDSSLVPTFLLCQETRKHVTVALGGDGGDELFAGYDPFRALKWAQLYQKWVPRPVHRAIRMLFAYWPTSHVNMSFDFRVKRTLRGLSYPSLFWNSAWLGPLSPDELVSAVTESATREEVYEDVIRSWDGCPQDNLVDKTLQFYTDLYLQDNILVKTDRASMMNSLEVRAPFLDVEVAEFARTIPNDWKFRDGRTKFILKKALEPVLPSDIINRPKKGFGMPIGQWLRDRWVACPKSPLPYVNHAFLTKRWRDHESGRADHRAFLWNAWVLDRYVTGRNAEFR